MTISTISPSSEKGTWNKKKQKIITEFPPLLHSDGMIEEGDKKDYFNILLVQTSKTQGEIDKIVSTAYRLKNRLKSSRGSFNNFVGSPLIMETKALYLSLLFKPTNNETINKKKEVKSRNQGGRELFKL